MANLSDALGGHFTAQPVTETELDRFNARYYTVQEVMNVTGASRPTAIALMKRYGGMAIPVGNSYVWERNEQLNNLVNAYKTLKSKDAQ
ncbi:MAG: hypothetical protein Unbinned4162contig1001_20 [Prokaryotic dsDNA virus sp.]|nr:MAG: hypothetical protein Unbinned4162contig1001_20 [Prokaryotic dsDNA virus sp.]|tara:strand:+ start:13570 stop:13836 length:267 start_codon:yes stop_codon:yes gene_type:complete